MLTCVPEELEQGRKKMLSDGGADLVGGPATYGGLRACFQNFVYSETKIINRNHNKM